MHCPIQQWKRTRQVSYDSPMLHVWQRYQLCCGFQQWRSTQVRHFTWRRVKGWKQAEINAKSNAEVVRVFWVKGCHILEKLTLGSVLGWVIRKDIVRKEFQPALARIPRLTFTVHFHLQQSQGQCYIMSHYLHFALHDYTVFLHCSQTPTEGKDKHTVRTC